ncbi:MAG: HDOD domain-containing protein [Deltaproteobacteria bacterium]|nr:HDOD domain-containing protein [Deltaproteobacteria bacterium]MBZ0219086.1 HDOD domain-containing protein [Deltaproteobacteria bacterium]
MGNTVKEIHSGKTGKAKRETLRSKVLEILKISTVPAVLKRIIEVTEDPKSGISDLEYIIERDQAIASRVVAVSNAVFYGFPRKINTIDQAILVLGFEMVKGLAISTTLFSFLKNNKTNSVIASLWGHSFEVAMAAGMLARRTGMVSKETAFLAGLIHDIGRPLLLQILSKEYLEVCSFDRNCIEREAEAFGADHAEVGEWFVEKCKLPEDCTIAVKYHHRPEKCLEEMNTISPLAQIIYLANLIVTEPREKYAYCSPVHAHILASLKLTGDELLGFAEKIAAKRDEIRSFYD